MNEILTVKCITIVFFLAIGYSISSYGEIKQEVKSNIQNENIFRTFDNLSFDVEGTYSVGKTSCKISWNTKERSYTVKWKKGKGYTYLFHNDGWVFYEYDTDGTTYCGRFVFTSSDCSYGRYERADGKVLTVTKL